MILVIIQSSISSIELPDLSWKFTDKLVHFFVFGLLGWLMTRGFSLAKSVWLRNNPLKMTLIIGFLFGISDELHQYFVPGRQADKFDLLIDCAGILLFAIYYLWQNAVIRESIPTENL